MSHVRGDQFDGDENKSGHHGRAENAGHRFAKAQSVSMAMVMSRDEPQSSCRRSALTEFYAQKRPPDTVISDPKFQISKSAISDLRSHTASMRFTEVVYFRQRRS